LTKDGFLRKSPKSELAQVLKHHVPVIPTEVPSDEMQTALIIDFMAYCRKVPIKKLLLKTYEDLAMHLWTTFQSIFPSSQRIDIIFDLYLDQSIKQGERNRRSKEGCIEITIKTANQALPFEVDKFWGSSTNKMQLEQIFITWILENYSGSRPVFLGCANIDDITSCIVVSNGISCTQQLLKCDHEEADDRMLFHANHAINNDFKKIIIVSPDTDVLVNAIHHFSRWVFSDLEEMWIIGGKNGTQRQAMPVHTLVKELDGDVVEILPDIHALTGNSEILMID
jgi:hypothetical protein